MRITLSVALIGLLAWDYSAAQPGQSAVARFYKAADPTIIEPAGVFLREHLDALRPVFVIAVHEAGKSLMSYSVSEEASKPRPGDVSAVPVPKRSAQIAAPVSQHEIKIAEAPQPQVPNVPASQYETKIAEVSQPQAADVPVPLSVKQASTDTQIASDDLTPLLLSTNEEPFQGSCAQAALARPSLINSAITAAGRTTASSLNYLVHVAILESRLRTYAHAPTSTAAGLFQFTAQTWLAMLKRHGAAHDLGYYADAITKSDGRWVVSDRRLAEAILSLRQDPTVAAVMAAELANENAAIMRDALDREPSDGELYAAHFLGPQDAVTLIRVLATDPARSSATLFPDLVSSNPWIFRDPAGSDRSVSELYDRLTRAPSPAEIALFCEEGYRPPELAAKS